MLRLRTFGGLSIESPASRSAAASRRPLALLALLAVSGPRGISRDKVVALLWPESDAEHGRNSLSQILSALRRELAGDDPVLGTAEIRIDTDVLTSDVIDFEERIAAGDFDAATRLYTGPFLDGVFLRNTPEFERWVDRQRSRLEQLQADALERVAARATAREDYVTAAHVWRQRASLAPSDSRAALKLMESLVASGDPAAALAHYRVHQSLLREDVGIEPDATLAEFVAELRRGNGRPTAAPPAVARQDIVTVDSSRSAHTEAPYHEPPVTAPAKGNGFKRIGPRGARWIVGALAGASLIGASLAWRGAAPRDPASRIPRIQRLAVLPLVNGTGDTAVNTVADALTQELISSLLRAGVPVVGYYSVARYRGANVPLAKIGRELDVDAVATWVVNKQGSELGVTLEVASPRSGEGLWASTTYTVDSLRLPDVAVGAARELALHLAPRGGANGMPIVPASTSSARARMAYLIGMQTFFRNPASFQSGISQFQRAIREDSTYAPAWAGLGFSYIWAVDYGDLTATDACARARPAIERAAALDSGLSLVHLARARMLQDCDWNWKEAEREYRTAIAIEPSATNYRTYGWLLEWYLGRSREGVAMGDTAVASDPGSVLAHLALAWRLRGADDLDRAVSEAKVAIALDTGVIDGHWILAEVYLRRRDYAQAEREALAVKAAGGSLPSLTTLGEIYARTGRIAEARAYIRSLMDAKPVTGPARVAAARTQMALGDRDAALTTLERAVHDHIFIIPHQPYWDPLRGDPRFQALMRRMGL